MFGDIWRYWGPWAQMRSRLFELKRRKVTLVAIDGSDSEAMYPHGPAYWYGARPWPLPRAHGRIAFFKRELTPLTARLRYYGLLPGKLAERRLARYVKPIAFSIPEEKLATGEEPKTKLLATHVVDPEVQALVPGTATSYAFEAEADYIADLRASRFGITTKRQGWDCMRHYEQAAAGCVPCFRDLHRKPATLRPARARRDQLRPLHRPARAAGADRGDGGRGVRLAAPRGARVGAPQHHAGTRDGVPARHRALTIVFRDARSAASPASAGRPGAGARVRAHDPRPRLLHRRARCGAEGAPGRDRGRASSWGRTTPAMPRRGSTA